MDIVRKRLLRAFFGEKSTSKMPYIASVVGYKDGLVTLSNGVTVAFNESLDEGTKVLVVSGDKTPIGVKV